jgi:hypothetical protein
MARNPWKKLLGNVKLVANRHGGYGHEWSDDNQTCEPRVVSITWQDLKVQFHKQQGKCYWLGIALSPDDVFRTGYPLTMSVDRIDNARGYEHDNFVIASRFANLARGNTPHDEFKEIMEHINLPFNSKVYEFFSFN